jgi:acyl-coenzyme A synthetase/AMP-(fatty) acid ligase
MRPMMSEHDKKAVLLETSLGDLEYKFVFTEEEDAEKFRKVVHKEAAQAECEIQRKRLGHENLLSRTASVKYAESVAKKKEEDCPDAPVDSAQILAGMQNVEGVQY